MAYMRGEYYIYQGEDLEFYCPSLTGSIPMDKMDEYVVMRYAELVKEGKVKQTEKRALKNNYGNFGCDDIAKKYKRPTIVDMMNKIMKEAKERGDKNGRTEKNLIGKGKRIQKNSKKK